MIQMIMTGNTKTWILEANRWTRDGMSGDVLTNAAVSSRTIFTRSGSILSTWIVRTASSGCICMITQTNRAIRLWQSDLPGYVRNVESHSATNVEERPEKNASSDRPFDILLVPWNIDIIGTPLLITSTNSSCGQQSTRLDLES